MIVVPPTMPYASPVAGPCPLCHRRPVWRKRVYGHPVCKKCFYAFVNRRQMAYLIDAVLFVVPAAVLNFMLVRTLARSSLGDGPDLLISTAVGVGLASLFACKDGFAGRSPGKWAAGVRVTTAADGRPAGFAQSFKRNAPFLLGQIPFVGGFVGLAVVIIIAAQLGRGRRWGDGLAATRVVWQRYARSPVFGGTGLLCESCGYDLRGNASGTCPECGTPVSAPNAARLAAA